MKNWKIGESKIHGKGVLLTKHTPKGHNMGTCLTNHPTGGFHISQHLGKWINHSDQPNCVMVQVNPNKYSLITIKNIPKGGEATMSYHETPWFIASPQTLKIPTQFDEKYGLKNDKSWWT